MYILSLLLGTTTGLLFLVFLIGSRQIEEDNASMDRLQLQRYDSSLDELRNVRVGGNRCKLSKWSYTLFA
jgi:hypothetical protein